MSLCWAITRFKRSQDEAHNISNSIIDSWKFDDADNIWYAPVLSVAGDYFLIVYETTGNTAKSSTIDINTNDAPGDITPFITFYEWDSNTGLYMDAIRLGTSEYYLIAYQGESSDGYLRTLRVWNDDGLMRQSLVDVWEHDSSDGGYDSIVHVAGDVYAVAYRDGAGKVTVFTVTVDDTNGVITKSAIDTQLLSYSGYDCNMIHVIDTVYAISYRNASTNDGFLETISIDSSGSIGDSVIDTIEFDTADGYYPKMTMIDSDTVGIAYQSTSTTGYLKTFDISASGDISTFTFEWDDAYGHLLDAVRLGTSEYYLVAYQGEGTDGYICTMRVSNDGRIQGLVDTWEHDISDGGYDSIVHVAGDDRNVLKPAVVAA